MAYFYKITNIQNQMCYYGIVFGKNKTPQMRFEEHMVGKGGKFLYKEGVLKYGKENFKLEVLLEDDIVHLRNIEVEFNKTNLFPIGYNGNTSHAIVVPKNTHNVITEKRKKHWQDNASKKPIPPNWKGKKRSDKMKAALSKSKMNHNVSEETRLKISMSLSGTVQTDSTKMRRAESLAKSNNAFNRKKWLLVSPAGQHIVANGKIHEVLKSLGLSYSKVFKNNLNTKVPIISNRSPMSGWMFFNNERIIKEVYEE